MQKKPRAGILFLTIMMLWGIIYPQYAFTEEMYETVQSADAVDDLSLIHISEPTRPY